jgi:D-alanyl-D-alanine carboxypeptidase/D-alanyl-D-alanine-endopeptidase (penicillin-binding protein 4)
MKNLFIVITIGTFFIASCTSSKKALNTVAVKPTEPLVATTSVKSDNDIEKAMFRFLLTDSNFFAAHLGVSVYDPSEKKYLYNYQSDKYFIPASNTKLFTCYAAMKYLGDSLVGLRYVQKDNNTIEVEPNGDPTLLHPDFINQPVIDFLKKNKTILLTDENWKENPWGYGWSWSDYNDDYMAERSVMPLYGNVVKFKQNSTITVMPSYFQNALVNDSLQNHFFIQRDIAANIFRKEPSKRKFTTNDIPFYTSDKKAVIDLLKEQVAQQITLVHFKIDRLPDVQIIHSQPTDSLLKIMMHRSDNFFAEQTLLMVSNEKLGTMNDAAIIDTLLHTDYKDLPQKPKWVDGSGLSRYNLFSPQDFVKLLEKMKNDFAWNRITTILPTGNAGTLSGYYKNYAGKIYAKTGTVSNNLALSGYLITNKNKQLIFSVMVNNHQASASAIRRAIEKFLTDVIDKN